MEGSQNFTQTAVEAFFETKETRGFSKKLRRTMTIKTLNPWKNVVKPIIKAMIAFFWPLVGPNTLDKAFLIHLRGFTDNTWEKLVNYTRRFELHNVDNLLSGMLRAFLIGDEDNQSAEIVTQRMISLFRTSKLSPARKEKIYQPEGRERHFRTFCACLLRNQNNTDQTHEIPNIYPNANETGPLGIDNLDNDNRWRENFDPDRADDFAQIEDFYQQNDWGEFNIEDNQLFPNLDLF